MSEWSPIEAAPRDETRILLWHPRWDDVIVIGWWSEFHGGWFNAEDEGGVGWGVIEPTHWTPLPQTPRKSGQTGED